jgi:cold shock CspA family protein
MSSDDVVTPLEAPKHLIGRVKWFNTKAGYGFITVTDGDQAGTDVFAHHSDINVVNQQYKYLVQGEYVEFCLTKVESEKYEWQASNVSGIKGGKLMCETRHELKASRNEYKSNKPLDTNEVRIPRQKQVSDNRKMTSARVRGEGPRESDKKEWTLVENKKVPSTKPNRSLKPRVNSSPQNSTIITIQSK